MWGPIIAAGINTAGSLLGGLLGGGGSAEGGGAKKAKHHQLDYDRRRIKAIVDGANDAGIHPLAALGAASGGGGFAAPVNSGSSGFGLGDAISGGMASLSDAFANAYESDQDRMERDQERKELQRERALDNLRSKEITPEIKLQRENMQLQNDLLRADIARSRTALANARSVSQGGAPVSGTYNLPFGMSVTPVPGRASAQDIEDIYGDIGEEVYGGASLIEDIATGRMTVGRSGNPLTNLYHDMGGSKKPWFDLKDWYARGAPPPAWLRQWGIDNLGKDFWAQ